MRGPVINARSLIEKRKLIEEKKKKEFNVEVKDLGVFRFRTPDIFDLDDAQNYGDGKKEDDFIIYTCCIEPKLNDKELLEAYEVTGDAIGIVDKLLLPGEKAAISRILVEKAGYNEESAKIAEEIKN